VATSTLSALVLAAAAALAPGQEATQAQSTPLVPHRFVAPPTVDGRLAGDEEWQAIAPLPLVTLYPAFRTPPTERTEIRVGYDDEYVYASIRAWDSDVEDIRATTLYRDRWQSDDEFVIILDTFGDGQSAAMFLVTPAGVRVDNQLTHDAEPGRGEWMNRDWNVPWDAAATVLADGWIAEMRVPFSSLRFETVDDRVTMRLKAYRYLPRKGENQIFPATRPDAGAQPHFKPSIGQPVVFDGIRAGLPTYIQPFVTATSASGNGDGSDVDAGLDLKFVPARATTVDVTLNTDFAQVEVDRLQVNLTRFPLRFPERRPFFLERAGLFAVGLGGDDTLFHSRRIGLTADGQPQPVRVGARVVSRIGGWDVGALDVQVGEDDEGGVPENAGAVRAQRVTARGDAFGFGATSLHRGGSTSWAAAADASIALGRDRLSAVWAMSDEDDTPASPAPGIERSRGMLRIQRGAEQGLFYNAEYRFTGRQFAPALGFVRLSDAHEMAGRLGQTWRPEAAARLRRHGWSLDVASRWRRLDAALEESRVAVEWNAETPAGVFGRVRLQRATEDVPAGFEVAPGTSVAPGRYDSTTGRVTFATPPATVQVFSTVETGGFYGGRRHGWRVEPVWTPSRHFQGWVIVDSSRFPGLAGQPPSSIDLVIVGMRTAFSTKAFLDLDLQRSSGVPAIGQLRFRWNVSEGHDLWVVAEHGRRVEGARSTALTVKYTRLFTLLAGRT
jgi:hypothetical protein